MSSFVAVLAISLLSESNLQAFDLGGVVKKVTGDVKKAAKNVEKETKKAGKKAAKAAKKGVKEVEDLGKDALKTLKNLGLPTDPKELVELIFSKMPEKQLKAFASKIMDIFLDQFSDLAKVIDTIMLPLRTIVAPIPLLPSTDAISNFVMDVAIHKYQLHSFAFLRAFHLVTNNRYLDEKDKKLIQSREDFEKRKGVLGKEVDLKKYRSISSAISTNMKKYIDPLEKLVKQLEDAASPLLKPLESLGREFRPVPFGPFITNGPIYNRAIFICNIKQVEGVFDEAKLILENGLQNMQKDKSRYTSLVDWEKDPMAKDFMKILRKTLAPANKALERLDEIFIDPISEIPWAMKTVLSIIVLVLSTSSKIMGTIVKEVFAETINGIGTAISSGAAGPAVGVVTTILKSVINEDFVMEFITETFYWSWIRYLQRRMAHISDLIKRAQADGVQFDSNRFKLEVKNVVEYGSQYGSYYEGVNDQGSVKKDKQSKKDKKGKSDKKKNPTPVDPAITTSLISAPQSQIKPAFIKQPVVSQPAAVVPLPAVTTSHVSVQQSDQSPSEDESYFDEDEFGFGLDDDFEYAYE